MTDLERVKELMTSLGLEGTIRDHDDDDTLEYQEGHGNVGGYTGFSADFVFDKSGKFLTFGVWE